MERSFTKIGIIPERFDALPELPTEFAKRAGIYRVIADKELPRLVGASRTLYVGSAAVLGRRLSPSHGVLWSLRNLIRELPSLTFELEVAAFEPDEIPWKVAPGTWARFHESIALAKYRRTHLEHPPFNARGEGDVVSRSLTTLGEALTKFRIGIQEATRPVDEPESSLTWMALLIRQGQDLNAPVPQLIWAWPEHHWGERPWWQKVFAPDSLHLLMPDGNPLRDRLPALDFVPREVPDSSRTWHTALLARGWEEAMVHTDLTQTRASMHDVIERLRAGRLRAPV